VTIPLFEFPGEAARALGLVAQHGLWLCRPEGVSTEVPPDVVQSASAVVESILGMDPRGRWLDRDQAATLLRSAGFRVADHRTVDRADDALAAANDLGYPVVLKATGVDRFHRGEGGGVALDLHDDGAVRAAYDRMVGLLGDAMHPTVVQEMVPPGADVLVGAHQHPSFGGVMSIGIGGVMAAANPELPMRILPLTDSDAERLVRSSPIAPLLAAEDRDGGAASVCTQFLAQLSAVLEALPEIADVLLNPLIVDRTGACIVDAWVRVAPYDWDASPAVRRL
jgi:acyl-CoA synthetase (NDP forming)